MTFGQRLISGRRDFRLFSRMCALDSLVTLAFGCAPCFFHVSTVRVYTKRRTQAGIDDQEAAAVRKGSWHEKARDIFPLRYMANGGGCGHRKQKHFSESPLGKGCPVASSPTRTCSSLPVVETLGRENMLLPGEDPDFLWHVAPPLLSNSTLSSTAATFSVQAASPPRFP